MREADPDAVDVLMFAVCEHVHYHSGTNRVSLIGVFDPMEEVTLTSNLPQVGVYAEIVGLAGGLTLQLVVSNGQTDDAVAIGNEFPITAEDPRYVNRVDWPVPAGVFRESGVYLFQLRHGGVNILTRRLRVLLPEDDTRPPPNVRPA